MKTGDYWNGWYIDSLIGEGSFGKVYKITRKEFGHTYKSALKIIKVPHNQAETAALKNAGMSDENLGLYYQGIVDNIASEIAVMSELKGNTNIVSYEDHKVRRIPGSLEWEIAIRMELVTPLNIYTETHGMSVNDTIKMGAELCRALEVCQQFRIVHRDIKPENIFVSEQGHFKLGDFGIAKQLDKANTALSKKGTPAYMAPEVFRGEKYDWAADQYSLGLVLYKSLNDGRLPFLPTGSSRIRFQDKESATVKRLNGEKLEPPCNADENVSAVILRACAFDPEDRYKDASEMRKDLEALYSGGVICKSDDKRLLSTDALRRKRKRRIFASASALILLSLFVVYEAGKTEVPAVVGLTEDEAKTEIESSMFEYAATREFSDDVEQGVVIRQEPSKGESVSKGAEIKVVVSRGKAFNTPDLTRCSLKKAKYIVAEKGFEISEQDREYSDISKGLICRQKPEIDEYCEKGQIIKVWISEGKEPVTVPDVGGVIYPTAQKTLEETGLKVEIRQETVEGIERGIVFKQSLKAGSVVGRGDKIIIYVAKPN